MYHNHLVVPLKIFHIKCDCNSSKEVAYQEPILALTVIDQLITREIFQQRSSIFNSDFYIVFNMALFYNCLSPLLALLTGTGACYTNGKYPHTTQNLSQV